MEVIIWPLEGSRDMPEHTGRNGAPPPPMHGAPNADGGPYAADEYGMHLSGAEVGEIATGMVLDGNRRPPECG